MIAVGTTVTRALETVAAPDGTVAAGAGWTTLVITPERGVRAVDGLITGWHDPDASHLLLLEAVAGAATVTRVRRRARGRLPLARVRRRRAAAQVALDGQRGGEHASSPPAGRTAEGCAPPGSGSATPGRSR